MEKYDKIISESLEKLQLGLNHEDFDKVEITTKRKTSPKTKNITVDVKIRIKLEKHCV